MKKTPWALAETLKRIADMGYEYVQLSSFLGRPVEIPLDEELYYQELMKRVATSRRKTTGKTVFADTSNSYKGTKV